MIQIFGNYREALPTGEQFLMINFSSGSIPVKQRWRNNGLSADFVADYLVTFFPAVEDDPGTRKRRAELKGAVSYIANELLENTLKYHDNTSLHPIRLGIYLLEKTVVLFSTNHVSEWQLTKLRETLDNLLAGDPEELYLRQLEKLAEEDDSDTSGMGLLTIVHDYQAKLGWKIEIEGDGEGAIEVTTMVELTI